MPAKSISESRAGSSGVPSASQNTATQLPVEDSIFSDKADLEFENVAQLAYFYWQQRGCPDGSPEQDWFQAEQAVQLRRLAKQVDRETNTLGLNQTMTRSA